MRSQEFANRVKLLLPVLVEAHRDLWDVLPAGISMDLDGEEAIVDDLYTFIEMLAFYAEVPSGLPK